jgi:hypothetical protein
VKCSRTAARRRREANSRRTLADCRSRRRSNRRSESRSSWSPGHAGRTRSLSAVTTRGRSRLGYSTTWDGTPSPRSSRRRPTSHCWTGTSREPLNGLVPGTAKITRKPRPTSRLGASSRAGATNSSWKSPRIVRDSRLVPSLSPDVCGSSIPRTGAPCTCGGRSPAGIVSWTKRGRWI